MSCRRMYKENVIEKDMLKRQIKVVSIFSLWLTLSIYLSIYLYTYMYIYIYVCIYIIYCIRPNIKKQTKSNKKSNRKKKKSRKGAFCLSLFCICIYIIQQRFFSIFRVRGALTRHRKWSLCLVLLKLNRILQ